MATWRADQLHPLRFLQPRAAPNSDLANNFVVMWLGALKARGVVAPDIALQAVGGADSNLHSVICSLDDLLRGFDELHELHVDGGVAHFADALGGEVGGIHETLHFQGREIRCHIDDGMATSQLTSRNAAQGQKAQYQANLQHVFLGGSALFGLF